MNEKLSFPCFGKKSNENNSFLPGLLKHETDFSHKLPTVPDSQGKLICI